MNVLRVGLHFKRPVRRSKVMSQLEITWSPPTRPVQCLQKSSLNTASWGSTSSLIIIREYAWGLPTAAVSQLASLGWLIHLQHIWQRQADISDDVFIWKKNQVCELGLINLSFCDHQMLGFHRQFSRFPGAEASLLTIHWMGHDQLAKRVNCMQNFACAACLDSFLGKGFTAVIRLSREYIPSVMIILLWQYIPTLGKDVFGDPTVCDVGGCSP